MAYTDKTKVLALFRDLAIEATDTVIVESELNQFILEADTKIDAALDKYYETPLTGAKTLIIVGEISTLFVAHKVKMVLEVNEQISDQKQQVQGNLMFQAEKMLMKLLPQWNKSAERFDVARIPLPDAVRREFPPQSDAYFQSQTKANDELERVASNSERFSLDEGRNRSKRVLTKGTNIRKGEDNW